MTVRVGVACRVHAGCAVEGFDFESGVVGETVAVVVFVDVTRLLQGVAFERVGGFRDVGVAADVRKADYLDFIAQYGAYFVQFVGVVRSKN